MKKILTLTIALIIGMQNAQAQQLCETPMQFNAAFKALSATESAAIKATEKLISTSVEQVTKAVNAETKSILTDFQNYIAQRIAYDDAMNKMSVIRDRKAANVNSQLKNRTPDIGNKACGKSTGAQNWTISKSITKNAANTSRNGYLHQLNKNETSAQAAEKTLAKHTEWFSDTVHKNNPFLNADINAGSLFGHSTFRHDASTNVIPVPNPDTVPNTLVAAQQFSRNIIGNSGIDKVTTLSTLGSQKSQTKKAKQNRNVARKNLAFSPFAEMLARRTTVKGAENGKWLRSYYIKLSKEGTGYSESIAPTIADNISEYEMQEHMYSKLYTNPDWITSLEGPSKQLQLEELEIINKNLALEWDTLLALEKLATLDGVNLATTLDKQ